MASPPLMQRAMPMAPTAILVVDDDPAIRGLLAEMLDMEGYPVQTAANGIEALAALEREPPALVILDMRMPVMDGWAFAREARRRGATAPILVMTAAQNARRWAEEIAADGFLAKPFDMDELLQTVGRLLQRSGS